MPDRPGYTDTPTALPAGALQLEAGVTDDHADGIQYTSFGETLLRAGIGAHTELRLFGNSYSRRSTSGESAVWGIEDPKIGVKTSLRSKPDSVYSALPNIAVLAAVTLPVGSSVFRGARAQPEAKVAVNWTTPSPLSVYSNLGTSAAYNGTAWSQRGWLSVALWYAINAKVSLFGEEISTRSLRAGVVPSNFTDAGITYLINDRFQLDLRAGDGLGSTSGREHFIGAGFARRW